MKLFLVKARETKQHIMREIGLCREDQIEQVKANYYIENNLLENGVPIVNVVFSVIPFDVEEDEPKPCSDENNIVELNEKRSFLGDSKKESCAILYKALEEYNNMDLQEIKDDIRKVSREYGQIKLSELTGININTIVGYKRKVDKRPPFENYLRIMNLKK